ncbi:MAG TPA: hypothetical protein VFZ12_07855 [Dehalococcoidia bacterium]|nr:hypothetical protein [Dehalococcoidia bacterium]
MASRKGLRVTCAVCSRVFYVNSWGDELPEHRIGRGEAPLCSGSLRAEYLPGSNDAMAAQLEWASGRMPDVSKAPRRSKPGGQSKIVGARRADEKRLQTQISKANSDLNDLLEKGIDLHSRRAESEPQEALTLLTEHEEVLRAERQLRAEIARAQKKMERLDKD